MKTRCIFLALLIALAASAFAQSRSDVTIFLPLIVAEDPAQAEFFRKNFTMEITSAGYTVAESIQEADYSLRITVRRNMIVYDDGTSEPAPDDEHEFLLQLNLMRNSDTEQIVSLSFGFDELEEMYNHNLSLIYQVMANVPLGGSDSKTLVRFMVGKGEEPDDWWRNKWLYLRLSADYPIHYYQIKPDDSLYRGNFLFKGEDGEPDFGYSTIADQTVAIPGATVGLEVQFLQWMSFELDFAVRLGDTAGFGFMPAIGAQVKFPFKPAAYFMLEPYAAVVTTNNEDHSFSFTRYAIGGGIQLGVKAGNAGVLFFDVNYMHPLGEAITRNADENFTQPELLHWNRYAVGLSLGYKIGFLNRVSKREEPSIWLFSN